MVLLFASLTGCIEMDDSPSMQAELRSAKAELVAATKELREAIDELKALKKTEAVRAKSAAHSNDVLDVADRIVGAATLLKCSSSNRCAAPAELLATVLSDEPKLRKQARLRTVRSKGKITGFRVDQVKEGSLADLLGLERADEIQKVMGIRLDKMGKLKGIMAKAEGVKYVTATIKRGKRKIALRIEIK